jgi:hypothetical protein
LREIGELKLTEFGPCGNMDGCGAKYLYKQKIAIYTKYGKYCIRVTET